MFFYKALLLFHIYISYIYIYILPNSVRVLSKIFYFFVFATKFYFFIPFVNFGCSHWHFLQTFHTITLTSFINTSQWQCVTLKCTYIALATLSLEQSPKQLTKEITISNTFKWNAKSKIEIKQQHNASCIIIQCINTFSHFFFQSKRQILG